VNRSRPSMPRGESSKQSWPPEARVVGLPVRQLRRRRINPSSSCTVCSSTVLEIRGCHRGTGTVQCLVRRQCDVSLRNGLYQTSVFTRVQQRFIDYPPRRGNVRECRGWQTISRGVITHGSLLFPARMGRGPHPFCF